MSECESELESYSEFSFDDFKEQTSDGVLDEAEMRKIYDFLSRRTAIIVHGLLKSRLDLSQAELML